MKTCWIAFFLAILIGIAVFLIGAIGYDNKKELTQQNKELDLLLQEERDKVEELEEIINRSGSFTLSVEIR